MDRNEWKYEIAKRLRRTMEERHMNATELSQASGVGKSDISNYLSGKYKPKQDKIWLLAMALGVDPAWLYCLDMRLAIERAAEMERVEAGSAAVIAKLKNVLPITAMPSHRIPLIGSAAAGEPVYNEEVNVYIDGPVKGVVLLKAARVQIPASPPDGPRIAQDTGYFIIYKYYMLWFGDEDSTI